ncbi:MAG: UTP--glucose-1-phosphate uridylyltransferase GalU [Burkholderiaceae bacterium]|jgi:UTP--glucose-1-phosphate uridylyltransferase|nr:UTP--glucose-1-phosphate uridylyltransferase GalU [Burkholderiaceae bacterium]MDP4862175.1 UTP--glucose-1-phosphate uridylyltransferase GalU [Burkholderiaceae bacterium]
MKPVRKAVFPVGGMGTRFLPATMAIPKEMLPVVDKPLIQYAVEEAYAAGIREMIFVTGRHKRAIEDHFDTAFELESALEASQKHDLLAMVHAIKPDDMTCVYVRQPRPLGLGHAVLCAEPLVGDEPFAVLLADDLMLGQPPVMAQMVDAYAKVGSSILAVQDVPSHETKRYGIVDTQGVSGDLVVIKGLVEKPAPEVAPSTLAVAGRYVLNPSVFAHIRQQSAGAGGELQLTDGIAGLMRDESVYAYRYNGARYDCGTQAGFLEATVHLALNRVDLQADFKQYLRGLDLG